MSATTLPALGKNGQQVYDHQAGDERKASKPWKKQSGKLAPIPDDKRATIGGVLGQARALFQKPLEKRASTDALSASVAALVLAKPQEANANPAPADFGQRSTVVADTISDARSELDPLAAAKAEELAKIEARKRAQIKQLGLLKTAFCDRYASQITRGVMSHATAVSAGLKDAPTKEELDNGHSKLSSELQFAYNWVIVDLQTKVKAQIKHDESQIDLLQDLISKQLLKGIKSESLVKDIKGICPNAFSDPDTYIP